MIKTALVAAACAGAAATVPPANPYESPSTWAPANQIDELVAEQCAKQGIQPGKLCSDAVFVRRVYLDVIGTIPAPFETQGFLTSRDPNKRAALIDRLLEKDQFADYWAMKWSDLLRVKAEFPINLWPNAAQAYHRWIRTSIKENVPYTRFVRDLLTASGSNFRVPPANFYRAVQNREPQGLAQAVALTFMGTRADKWPTNQLAGMAAFFSKIGYKATDEWKEEIVFFDPRTTNGAAFQDAVFPDGTRAGLMPDQDPREGFADWLIDPKNPWFTRNIANRVWSWLMGRGIIEEPDDIRPDNPPGNPQLLALLEEELIGASYDLKRFYRLILNSKTYQVASTPTGEHVDAEASFAAYPVRRLEAEVLIDAIDQITGGTEKYSSAIPEPFTFIPEDHRSIALPDGSISSSFLELFGRSPRATGLESERNNRLTAAQSLHLLNSTHIQRKIEQSRMIDFQTQPGKTPRQMAWGIYLVTLCRYPTETELRTVESYFDSGKVNRRQAAVDLAWALINSPEFLYRH
jgi:hypothetical protein